MKLVVIAMLLVFGAEAHAQTFAQSYPCSSYHGSSEIDLNNSDDLFFAGHKLVRLGRNLEGVDCLNRGKTIAPAYLDIRLELINAFAQLSDVASANAETYELYQYELNPYYVELLAAYRAKVNRVVHPKPSHPNYKFKPVFSIDLGRTYRKLVKEEVIVDEVGVKKAVSLMDTGFFVQAEEMFKVLLSKNPHSPTVNFYAGICAFQRMKRELSLKLLAKAAELSYYDLDIVLIIARNLNYLSANKEAYHFLTSYKHQFVSYGCFQYGEVLHRILFHLSGAKAAQVDQILNQALDNKNDPLLCDQLRKF